MCSHRCHLREQLLNDLADELGMSEARKEYFHGICKRVYGERGERGLGPEVRGKDMLASSVKLVFWMEVSIQC